MPLCLLIIIALIIFLLIIAGGLILISSLAPGYRDLSQLQSNPLSSFFRRNKK